MFRHLLVPVDCTEESRHLMLALARFVGPLISCRLTLAAVMTPTDDPELYAQRKRHAEEALIRLHDLLLGYGIWTRGRVLEGEDHAAVLAAESRDPLTLYDAIVCGTHQTLPQNEERPCHGSLVDKIGRQVKLPVIVLSEPEAVRVTRR